MPDPAHNRHTFRLPGYDYARAGGYFVTIVTHGRESALGAVVDGNVILSNPGHAVYATWNQIPHHFSNVVLDEFVIMPNHVHGIIMIMDADRTTPDVLYGVGRGKSTLREVLIATLPDLPLRANHDRAVHRLVAARPAVDASRPDPLVAARPAVDARRAGTSPAPTGDHTLGDIVGAVNQPTRVLTPSTPCF